MQGNGQRARYKTPLLKHGGHFARKCRKGGERAQEACHKQEPELTGRAGQKGKQRHGDSHEKAADPVDRQSAHGQAWQDRIEREADQPAQERACARPSTYHANGEQEMHGGKRVFIACGLLFPAIINVLPQP